MKIYNFEQHSTEWENIRKGKITASIFKNLITTAKLEVSKSATAKQTIAKIVASKIAFQNSDDFQTFAMAKGTDCEPRARQLYQEMTFTPVEEVGFIEDDSGYAGFSPDGLIKDGMIEVKTQNQAKHFYCKLYGFDEWLNDYKPQILFSMAIHDGIKFCDCISYNEDFANPEHRLFIHRYERNEEEVAKVKEIISYWVDILKEHCKTKKIS